MQSDDSMADDAKCSFCRKEAAEVGPLVEGPGPQGNGRVLICRECAELSLSIFEQEEQHGAMRKAAVEEAHDERAR